MNKEDIIRMAREAGAYSVQDKNCDVEYRMSAESLERFAALIAEQALAQLAEPVAWAISYNGKKPYALWDYGDGPLLDSEIKRLGGTACKLALYTSPQQALAQPAAPVKVWDAEGYDALMQEMQMVKTERDKLKALVRAIEAKLKEKNNG